MSKPLWQQMKEALTEEAKIDPKVRFYNNVEAGLIDEDGKVILDEKKYQKWVGKIKY